jgi:hypothetical protein
MLEGKKHPTFMPLPLKDLFKNSTAKIVLKFGHVIFEQVLSNNNDLCPVENLKE